LQLSHGILDFDRWPNEPGCADCCCGAVGEFYSKQKACKINKPSNSSQAVIFCCVTFIRNLYFHPLSKFPGPKIAAVSHLWYAYVMHRGVAPIEMSKLHKRYGPVVRVAPDELSFSSAAAVKEIYGYQKGGRPELVKDKKYHKFVSEPILINADREYHGILRKLLSHGFSESGLRAQEAVIQEHVSMLMLRLREHGHEGQVAVDVTRWYNVC
jgi:hypothetical protein